MMRKHASALTGSRRKPDQKPVVKKILKRKGSMDEATIDRLSEPVDHSKLKQKFENEQISKERQ